LKTLQRQELLAQAECAQEAYLNGRKTERENVETKIYRWDFAGDWKEMLDCKT
jgi:uncharacterized protein with NAD-binding domain and iron-sulfur cluster